MSYNAAYAAMHLEMPPEIPRTEFSAEFHWPLVRRVTGLKVYEESDSSEQYKASLAFRRAWDYSFAWSTNLNTQYYNGMCTNMGHAVYRENGTDRNDNIYCPFTEVEQVLSFDPYEHFQIPKHAELVKMFNDAYKGSKQAMPDEVPMVGTYTTILSGMIAIFGWEMLLEAAGEDSERFGRLVDRYASWVMRFYEAMADSDAENIMIHDDMVWTEGPFIKPSWYRKYVFPNLKKYIAPLKEAGKLISFTSDGNYDAFVDDLVDCGVDGFVLEPLTDMKYIAEKYGKTHYFIGNADTRILLFGDKEAIENEVKRCLDIGKSCPGFFMAVGNHIPPNTPVEACLWYNEYFMKHRRR